MGSMLSAAQLSTMSVIRTQLSSMGLSSAGRFHVSNDLDGFVQDFNGETFPWLRSIANKGTRFDPESRLEITEGSFHRSEDRYLASYCALTDAKEIQARFAHRRFTQVRTAYQGGLLKVAAGKSSPDYLISASLASLAPFKTTVVMQDPILMSKKTVLDLFGIKRSISTVQAALILSAWLFSNDRFMDGMKLKINAEGQLWHELIIDDKHRLRLPDGLCVENKTFTIRSEDKIGYRLPGVRSRMSIVVNSKPTEPRDEFTINFDQPDSELGGNLVLNDSARMLFRFFNVFRR
jgi:hypothetical protein